MREMIEVFTCDRCAKRIEGRPNTVKIHVGWTPGAVVQEHDIKVIDLCCFCSGVGLQRLINYNRDFCQAEAMAEALVNPNPLGKTELP